RAGVDGKKAPKAPWLESLKDDAGEPLVEAPTDAEGLFETRIGTSLRVPTRVLRVGAAVSGTTTSDEDEDADDAADDAAGARWFVRSDAPPERPRARYRITPSAAEGSLVGGDVIAAVERLPHPMVVEGKSY